MTKMKKRSRLYFSIQKAFRKKPVAMQPEKIIMVRPYRKACEILANWWVEKAFRTPLNQNNGDDSPIGGMVFMLQNMVSMKAKQQTTDDQIENFKNKIIELLLPLENGHRYNSRYLTVDYHPNEILAQACAFAGIDEHILPCKTCSRIEKNNSVFASYQYGGQWLEISSITQN